MKRLLLALAGLAVDVILIAALLTLLRFLWQHPRWLFWPWSLLF